MKTQTGTQVNIFKGQITFGPNDKDAFRIIVILLIVVFVLGLALILKQWLLPVLAAKGISGLNLGELFKITKGKGP